MILFLAERFIAFMVCMLSIKPFIVGAALLLNHKQYAFINRMGESGDSCKKRGLSSQQDRFATSPEHKFFSNKPHFDCEIVGGTGRIGSFLIRQIAKNGETTKNNSIYQVPRQSNGSRTNIIGEHSLQNSPIYVATPANAIPNILSQTVPNRRQDLVFVCNGLVARIINEARLEQKGKDGVINSLKLTHNVTIVVPHFGILAVDADPVGRKVPSVLYGRHASIVAKLFGTASLPLSVVTSLEEVSEAAALKLLWASLMWLLTRDERQGTDMEQCTVSQVHDNDELQNILHDLVKEMLPIVKLLSFNAGEDGQILESNMKSNDISTITDIRETLAYLEKYSRSIPDAKPNFDLALNEFMDRNGQFLLLEDNAPQPCHRALLRRVLGDDIYEQKILELAADADRVQRRKKFKLNYLC